MSFTVLSTGERLTLQAAYQFVETNHHTSKTKAVDVPTPCKIYCTGAGLTGSSKNLKGATPAGR